MFKSLQAKTNFLYLALALILFAVFLGICKIAQDNNTNEEEKKHLIVISGLDTLYKLGTSESFVDYLDEVGYICEDDEQKKAEIINNSEEKISKKIQSGFIKLYYLDDKYYIYLPDSNKIFKGKENINKSIFFVFSIFILCGFLLFVLYKTDLKIIKELRQLSIYIKKWSKQEKNNDLSYTKYEEINDLILEFDKAKNRIDELILSRQFFLRAIMHELKTPIGKGMILLDLPDNEKNKEILKQVFERLDLLTNEFSKIEKVISKNYELNTNEYSYSILYEQVKDIMFLDDENSIVLDIKYDEIIRVDMELFSLLLKNLLDNALKYSSDNKCYLSFYKDGFSVKNKGEKLNYDINEYYKPFTRGDISKKGLGLGLYLIKYICDIHKFKLFYTYEDGYHVFRIVL